MELVAVPLSSEYTRRVWDLYRDGAQTFTAELPALPLIVGDCATSVELRDKSPLLLDPQALAECPIAARGDVRAEIVVDDDGYLHWHLRLWNDEPLYVSDGVEPTELLVALLYCCRDDEISELFGQLAQANPNAAALALEGRFLWHQSNDRSIEQFLNREHLVPLLESQELSVRQTAITALSRVG